MRRIRRVATSHGPGADLARSGLRYAPVHRDEQEALTRRIEELAGAHPRFGYRRIWALLDREAEWSTRKPCVASIASWS